MGCNCGRGSKTRRYQSSKVSTASRKRVRCNSCNLDITSEYTKQVNKAQVMLKGTSSVKIHVVCPKCKATTVISTNL